VDVADSCRYVVRVQISADRWLLQIAADPYHIFQVEIFASMAGKVAVQAPGGIDKVGAVCESDHKMISHLTYIISLQYMTSVSSLVSIGQQIDCSFLLKKELSQLTPVILQATMYSKKLPSPPRSITPPQ
jgi:hypothetical protein